jgi:hypothetical protein
MRIASTDLEVGGVVLCSSWSHMSESSNTSNKPPFHHPHLFDQLLDLSTVAEFLHRFWIINILLGDLDMVPRMLFDNAEVMCILGHVTLCHSIKKSLVLDNHV